MQPARPTESSTSRNFPFFMYSRTPSALMRSPSMKASSTRNALLISPARASTSALCARRIFASFLSGSELAAALMESSLIQGSLSIEAGGGAQFFFDAEELVVLGDAVGAAGRTGLDLAGGGGHGEIGDESVFGFAGAVRDDGVVAGLAGHFDRIDRFSYRADLIELDENGVGNSLFDAA